MAQQSGSDKVSSAFCSAEPPQTGSPSGMNLDERPFDFPEDVMKS